MSNLSMKFFMREELKKDEIIEVPGLKTFCDTEGKPIPLQIKVLGVEEINKIKNIYTKTKVVIDDKGKRLYDKSGNPVMATECNNTEATNRMIVEALVLPNLKDPELMEYYDCKDCVEMPMKVFKKSDAYSYISKEVIKVCGLSGSELSDDELIEEAKN